jgi:hypothetical protein
MNISASFTQNLHATTPFEGRKIADKLGIKIIGLLGVLILTKKQGLIIQIKPVVDKLLKAGFRLNKKLVNKVLIALGEVK